MSVKYRAKKIAGLLNGFIRPRTAAIIVAAGSGKRMGDGEAKQFLTIDGKTVLAHTLLAFQKSKYIDEIIIVAREGDEARVRSIAVSEGITKLSHVVMGGKERSDSVMNGMVAVEDRVKFVAIHDAARCLITPEQIRSVVMAAYAYNAASAGVPVKDTVKRVDENGFIIETPERSQMWNASTPQVFRAELYRGAAVIAANDMISVTDDNMIMEYIGQRVKMINTGYENIKLTTQEDLLVMEAVLQKRRLESEGEKKSEGRRK